MKRYYLETTERDPRFEHAVTTRVPLGEVATRDEAAQQKETRPDNADRIWTITEEDV